MAAALLLVLELVGGGDCESARGRESAFPRPAAAQARATGARASLGEGRAVRPVRAPPLPAARGRARAPHSPPLPAPPGSPLSALPFPGPATPRAAVLTAARTRVPWRTRTLASGGCSLCLVQGSPPSVPAGSRQSGVLVVFAFQFTLAGSPGGTPWTPSATGNSSLPKCGLPDRAHFPRGSCLLAFFPPFFFLLMANVNDFLLKQIKLIVNTL